MPANCLDNLQKLAGELRENLARGGKIALIGGEGPLEVVPYRGFGSFPEGQSVSATGTLTLAR